MVSSNIKKASMVISIGVFLALLATYKYITSKGYIYLAEQFEVYTIEQFFKVVYPTWNDRTQTFSIADQSKLYYYAFLVFVGKLLGSYKFIQWLALALPFIISYATSYLLVSELLYKLQTKLPNSYVHLIALIGAFIYTVNPLVACHPRNVMLRISYSFVPLIAYFTLKILDVNSINKAIKYAVSVSFILSFAFGVRLLALSMLLIIVIGLVNMLLRKSHQKIKVFITSLMFILVLTIFLSLPKMLPSIIYMFINPIPAKELTLSMLIREPILNLLSLFPHNFVGFRFNTPYYDNTPYFFLVVTTFSFLYVILIDKNRLSSCKFYLTFPLVTLILSIMLSSREVNLDWLLVNSKVVARLLRHADRNIILLALSVSITTSYSLLFLMEKVRNKVRIKVSKTLFALISVLMIITTSIASWPIFTGDMNGYWNPAPPPNDYIAANNILKNLDKNNYSHVIWLPSIGDPRALWSKQKGPFPISAPTGIFGIRSSALPSYYIWDKYFFQYYNILNGTFGPVSPFPTYSGELARIYSLLNIKYITITYDREWPLAYKVGGITNERLISISKKLEKNQYIGIVYKGKYLSLFKLKNNASEITIRSPALCSCKLTSIASFAEILSDNSIPSLIYNNRQASRKLTAVLNVSKNIILTQGEPIAELTTLSANSVIIVPYDFSLESQPAKTWAKGTLLGYHLRQIHGITKTWNWDYDLGYGFVYTWAKYVTLDTSFEVPRQGIYNLFVRYFENQEGGTIRIYLDGKLIAEVSTVSQLNRFVWKDLGTFRLKAGRHVLTLENVGGFNAVNVFVLIPVEEYNRLVKELEKLLENKTIIYLLEAESDMFREKAEIIRDINASNGEVLYLEPGGYAWQRFEVVRDGYYMVALRLNGDARVKIDNITFTISSDEPSFQYIGPIYLSKGLHVIHIVPIVRVSASWSFANESSVATWRRYTSEKQFNTLYRVLWDSRVKAMRVELYNSTWGWKVIRSPLIPVRYGYSYAFMFKVKAVNGHKVRFKIFEYDENGELLNVTWAGEIGDGTFNWKKIIYIYKSKSRNVVYLQLQIWYEHLTNEPLPNIIWVKDVRVYEYRPMYFDVMWIYSVESPISKTTIEDLFRVKEKPAEIVSYERIDPTLWRVEVVAKKPFMLVFAEAFDPLWEARVYKDSRLIAKVRSIPVYDVINGFWINATGNLTIVIRYVPQDWFELGLKISATTFAFCILYLVWDWRRGRGDRWTMKLERMVRGIVRVVLHRRVRYGRE